MESATDDLNHHQGEIVEFVLELVEVVGPVTSLDVENVVFELTKTLHLELEGTLDVEELTLNFRTLGTTEAREDTSVEFEERGRNAVAGHGGGVERVGGSTREGTLTLNIVEAALARDTSGLALETELELANADFLKVHATMLDEGVDFGEDVNNFELLTAFTTVTFASGNKHFGTSRNPSFAGFDGLFEGDHRVFNITVKDRLEIDLLAAAVDDFVGDHAKKSEEAITFVVARMHQEHVDGAEQVTEHSRDLTRCGVGELDAGLFEGVEVAKVVDGFVGRVLVVSGEIEEGLEVEGAFLFLGAVHDVDDPKHVGAGELLTNVAEIACAGTPIFDFVEGASSAVASVHVLLINNFTNLALPV